MAAGDRNYISSNSIAINDYRIEEAPATVYYIPNFVSKNEEELILERVYKTPKPKWTQLSNRRLQNWGGIPHPKGMLVESIPEWLYIYLDKVWCLGVFEEFCKPNHVLINEYLAGQGIMPHFDGPLFYPTITTLSLGSHTVLNFYAPRSEECKDSEDSKMLKLLSLLVEPRSLLILKDEMYTKYLHGIDETVTDLLSLDDICNWRVCELFKDEQRDETKALEDRSSSCLRNMSASVVDKERLLHKNQDYNSPKVSRLDSENADNFSMHNSIIANVKDSVGVGLSDKRIAQALNRKTRISLTMRHVPKTSKVKIKLCR